jgi:polysaccharide pyruvyl transferase WcaK-like protein
LGNGATPIVGLNVSGLLAMGGYTGRNMFGLKGDYGKIISSLIELFIQNKGATVVLIPHVFGGGGNKSESDSVACRRIYHSLGDKLKSKVLLVEGRYDQSEIKYIIGLCDFFVGSRMHACIGALSQGIPALAIAYSDKFIGVLQTLEIDSLVADARQMDAESILRAASDSYDRRSSIRRCLEHKIPLVKDTVLRLFADVEDHYTKSHAPQLGALTLL